MKQVTHNEDPAYPVTLRNATFKWSKSPSEPTSLESLSWNVPKGALVSIFISSVPFLLFFQHCYQLQYCLFHFQYLINLRYGLKLSFSYSMELRGQKQLRFLNEEQVLRPTHATHSISHLIHVTCYQVAVIGTIGSGKSSLLSALLGNMVRHEGEANVCGKVAYVPQQAWIRNATLRNNILFGKKFNQEAYQKVSRFFRLYVVSSQC